VLYSGGWYNRSPDNAVLAESLASHGYVVAALPLFGAGLWTGNLGSSPAALETQARDLEAALAALVQHTWVDRTRVSVMGYSSGGIVALFVGARHALVDAIIGLDPAYGSDTEKVLSFSLFDPARVRVPVLTLRAGHETFVRRDRSAVLSAMRYADRYTADVGQSTHGDFSDDVRLEVALSLARPERKLRSTLEGMAAYRVTAQAVRLFLDGVLRNRPDALETLVGPDETLRITRTPAERLPR
jgi:dienelactone hydrolase